MLFDVPISANRTMSILVKLMGAVPGWFEWAGGGGNKGKRGGVVGILVHQFSISFPVCRRVLASVNVLDFNPSCQFEWTLSLLISGCVCHFEFEQLS